ncbi:MAG: Ig-like domain-containing protein [Phocaeicola sp.]
MNWKKHQALIVVALTIIVYSCASMGQPDGGPYDETPPKFVRSTPAPFTTNSTHKKIVIEFDEYIKLEKAAEKIIISPPQIEQPEIKASGKRVLITFIDSLKANTTYTIDFADAIVDNNEGNPLNDFSFTFSTGEIIDTLQVSGTVLNARDLEAIKSISVGLHDDLSDSAFTAKPFKRVSRTDSRGNFTIRGISPGKYRIYALMDGNQNYLHDSKTEMIAFSDSIIVPTFEGVVRQDTIWKTDSTAIDTILSVGYTKYLPNDIILQAFKEENDRQYLTKSERDKENHFILSFSAKADTLPTIKGLNFDEKEAFIIEKTPRNDSICYWIKDSLIYQMDTLMVQLDYLYTDTLFQLVPKTDTLTLANKLNREQRERLDKKAKEEKEKEHKKKVRAHKEDEVEVEKTKFLPIKLDAPSNMDINRNIIFSFEEPIGSIDTAAFTLELKVDTLWKSVPFLIQEDPISPRTYQILAEWMPSNEYQIQIDSAAIKGIYGLHTDGIKQTVKIKSLEEYGTLLLNVVGIDTDKPAIVELIDNAGKVLKQERVTKQGTADLYFLNPATKYYLRLFIDSNNNGVWDTGNYENHLQPEEVFYFPKVWEMKANFEFDETWDIRSTPIDKQKLDEIKKQKPEEAKKIKDRNRERAERLGRE